MTPAVRNAQPEDLANLATLWFEGWHEAHANILPADLAAQRTLSSFAERLKALLPATRVAGPLSAPLGLCITKDDELCHLYVSARARRAGVAAALLADAEARLAEGGTRTAWLACAINNERAANFYQRHAWHRADTMGIELETHGGVFSLDVWRFEKPLEVR